MKARGLSTLLASRALSVCQHYLPCGRRCGNYWQVGNVRGARGKSLYVRLVPDMHRRAGQWVDAATGEYGDLLDLIRETLSLPDLCAAMDEARRFLALPPEHGKHNKSRHKSLLWPVETQPHMARGSDMLCGHKGLAHKIWKMSECVTGTLAAEYLLTRGLSCPDDHRSLRFNKRLWFDKKAHHPALVLAVTDEHGELTGICRCYLRPSRTGVELIERRALGHLNGHGVRFGPLEPPVMYVGEGLETLLSATTLFHGWLDLNTGYVATLGAAHLVAFRVPSSVTDLVIIADNDPAGLHAAYTLQARIKSCVKTVRVICSERGDFNEDLMARL